MDTSFWIRFNPKITVEHTVKKYFGKYLYRLVVYAPAGRLIESKSSMADALTHRLSITKSINYGGYWGNNGYWASRNKDIDNADIEFLDCIRDIKHDKPAGIKMRVEEPRVQIYADTETALQDVVAQYFKPEHYQYIESVSGPADADAETLLNAGAIIRRKDNGYRYKILLRDGRYGAQVKSQLLQYLTGLELDQVLIPKSMIDTLEGKSAYTWNLYFYSNDLSLNTFISLINPDLILNHHELIVHK